MEFSFIEIFGRILTESGYAGLLADWRSLVMIAVACLLLYLGIVKKYEPLLMVPIAFGMLMANFPYTGILDEGGLFSYFYFGVEHAIYPSIIFLGIGAMTDFGPLIARPSSMLMGAGAQFGIFTAFLLALALGFSGEVAAAIGVIGGADGPTSIFVAGELTDGLGRAVEIPETVEKVVSLTAANTEIVYALGAGDLLVGADAYSDYPEEANDLPRMGDYAGPNVELIAAAEADVVLASTTLQQDAIEKMEALGLNVVCVEPSGLDELYEGIVLIAAVVGADPTPLLTDMQDAIAQTAAAVPADMEPVRVYFALSFGESGDFSAGKGTFIDELIAMAGGENVAADSEYAWPMYSLEGIVAADPDVILISDYGDGTAAEQFCALPGYGELRAVQEGHVYALTDDLISRPGPRIAEGFQQVVDALADAGAYD